MKFGTTRVLKSGKVADGASNDERFGDGNRRNGDGEKFEDCVEGVGV